MVGSWSSRARRAIWLPSQADGNGALDVFLYDRASGAVTLVSHASGSGTTAANGLSQHPAISADGSRVAFSSRATDLVPGAGGFGAYNIFLYELQTGTISLVSHSTASPTLGGNDTSDFPTLNADGTRVAFQSLASNLVTGSDTGNTWDVFSFERASGAISLVSHTPSSPTTSAGPDSVMPVLSRTGDDLVFVSSSSSLVVGTDSNDDFDVFLWESGSGVVSLVSHVPGSMGTAGSAASGVPPGLFPQGPVQQEISGDGSLVAFVSQANNLAGGPDGNIGWDVFVYQRATGDVILASHTVGAPTTAANDYSSWPSLAIDGSTVAFDCRATNLVAGMSGSGANVYFYDLASGAVALASHAVGSPTVGGNGAWIKPTIDATGAHIAFISLATDLLIDHDTNGTYDVFDYDRGTDSVLLASHTPSSTTSAGNGVSGADQPPLENAYFAISGDGLRVAFESDASDCTRGEGAGHCGVARGLGRKRSPCLHVGGGRRSRRGAGPAASPCRGSSRGEPRSAFSTGPVHRVSRARGPRQVVAESRQLCAAAAPYALAALGQRR
jgi:Tol biopolymer transport system component